jgi:hypothetical protein
MKPFDSVSSCLHSGATSDAPASLCSVSNTNPSVSISIAPWSAPVCVLRPNEPNQLRNGFEASIVNSALFQDRIHEKSLVHFFTVSGMCSKSSSTSHNWIFLVSDGLSTVICKISLLSDGTFLLKLMESYLSTFQTINQCKLNLITVTQLKVSVNEFRRRFLKVAWLNTASYGHCRMAGPDVLLVKKRIITTTKLSDRTEFWLETLNFCHSISHVVCRTLLLEIPSSSTNQALLSFQEGVFLYTARIKKAKSKFYDYHGFVPSPEPYQIQPWLQSTYKISVVYIGVTTTPIDWIPYRRNQITYSHLKMMVETSFDRTITPILRSVFQEILSQTLFHPKSRLFPFV